MKLWQFESRTLMREIQAHDKSIAALVFSPDGKRLATASNDRTIKIWNATADRSQLVHDLKAHQGSVYGISFSADGRRLASAGHDGNCVIWNLSNAQVQETIHRNLGPVRGVAFDPRGRYVAMGGNDAAVRNLQRRSEVLLPAVEPEILCVACSPDGSRVAAGSKDGTLRVWRASTGAVISTIAAHRARVSCVAFSPAGDRIASTGFDGSIKVWDPNSPEQETLALKGEGGRAYSMAFSPDGRYLASAGWHL